MLFQQPFPVLPLQHKNMADVRIFRIHLRVPGKPLDTLLLNFNGNRPVVPLFLLQYPQAVSVFLQPEIGTLHFPQSDQVVPCLFMESRVRSRGIGKKIGNRPHLKRRKRFIITVHIGADGRFLFLREQIRVLIIIYKAILPRRHSDRRPRISRAVRRLRVPRTCRRFGVRRLRVPGTCLRLGIPRAVRRLRVPRTGPGRRFRRGIRQTYPRRVTPIRVRGQQADRRQQEQPFPLSIPFPTVLSHFSPVPSISIIRKYSPDTFPIIPFPNNICQRFCPYTLYAHEAAFLHFFRKIYLDILPGIC